MGIVMFGLVVFMLGPVGLYIWYVAVHKPKAGRRAQETTWKPLAERIGGRFNVSDGVSRFHSVAVPYGQTLVTAIVFDRAALDPAIANEVHGYEMGGWRTFVQASVPPGGGGSPAVISPGGGKTSLPIGDAAFQQQHSARVLRQTPLPVLAARMTPQVCHAFSVLGGNYSSLVAGPSFVTLELPGVCTDPALIEAAIHVVGAFAQPSYA